MAPALQNLNVFLGAAMLGVISAAGLYLVEHYKQERRRYAMAKDLARLDRELTNVKQELQQLMAKKSKQKKRSRKSQSASNASTTTTEDYMSVSGMDSSDLEFYDVSDDGAEDNEKQTDALLSEVDHTLDEGSPPELELCLARLQDMCLEHPNHAPLLWRIGKCHHKLSQQTPDMEKNECKRQLERGIEACQKALELEPQCAVAHKWMAILIGSLGDYQSMRDKIEGGYRFKQHLDKAIELDGTDSTLFHLLGRFSFEVAGLRWYERKAASAFYATPPSATYDEALDYFMQCHKLADYDWKENKLMVAKCLVAMGRTEEAVDWLEQAKGGDDDKVEREVVALLAKYST